MRRLFWLIPLALVGLYFVAPRVPAIREQGAAAATTQADPENKPQPAPALKIAEWVKGQPVKLEDGRGKTVYVVEFWATWCPPCRESIPHLSELQQKYKDRGVVFIGISDESADKVRPFVAKMGDKMNYTVAIDDHQQTTQAYMMANGVNSIPHAFVVDKDGNIFWHGHPMDHLDQVLDRALQQPPVKK